MSTARRLHFSYDDYLVSLGLSELKLEYCEGVIDAMAGGTPAHAELGAAVIGLLRQALRGSCRVFTSDMKVRVEAADLSTFPDVTVVGGEPVASNIDANAFVNPTLLVEVTSTSTEEYDRGDKLGHYKQIPALRGVLFVSHRARCITRIERTGAGWEEREFRAGEVLSLQTPQLSLAVDDVYEGIALDPA